MSRSYAFPLHLSPFTADSLVSIDGTATEESSLRLSLLPENARDVAGNEEMWRIAQRGAFERARANAFIGRDVLAMSMPTDLFSLMRSLSWPAMQASLLEILALVVEDEDPDESLSVVLDECTWQALRRYMAFRRDFGPAGSGAHTGELTSRELAQSVEILLRLAEKSDRWRVPVTCLYVKNAKTPQARRNVRDLAEDRYGKCNQVEHKAFWTLYSLHSPLQSALKGVDAAELSKLLRDSVNRDPNAIPQALQLRKTLIAAKQHKHAFTELPADIVEEHIVPNILLTLLQVTAAPDPILAAPLESQISQDAAKGFLQKDWSQQGPLCGVDRT